MAIRTTEKDVPSHFPPARLFLDDIKEIVSILRELVESQKPLQIPGREVPEIQLVISTGGKECDDILDLPKIAKSNVELSVRVKRGFDSASFTVDPWFRTSWRFHGSNKDNWIAYNKLKSLIDNRKSRWSGLFHSCPWWAAIALSNLGTIAVVFLFIELYKFLLKFMPSAAVYALLILSGGILIFAVLSGIRHTRLKLRNSWDPSPLSSYLKDKLLPVAIGALIGLAGTLLGLYLKHKYWP